MRMSRRIGMAAIPNHGRIGKRSGRAGGLFQGGGDSGFSTAWKLFFHSVEKRSGFFHGMENF